MAGGVCTKTGGIPAVPQLGFGPIVTGVKQGQTVAPLRPAVYVDGTAVNPWRNRDDH